MIYILIIFGVLFAAGVYLVIADMLKFATNKVSRAIINVSRQDKKKTNLIETFILKLSLKLTNFVRLHEYKKRKITATLKSAGIALTPETFIAKAWIKTGLTLLTIIPTLLILPIVSPVVLFLAIAVYFKEIQSGDKLLRKKRETIEAELPRFVLTIEQEIKSTRDVLSILQTYKNNAGIIFCQELEITIADMKSGSFESALTRLETRLGSAMLSDVVRGLIGVLRGDNGIVYFQMLAHDFKFLQFQKLKLEAMKRPAKIRKYSFAMLGCFVITYLAVMVMEIMKAFNGIF